MMEKMETKTQEKSGITRRKSTQYVKFCPKEERNASLKKVSIILQKAENERTLEEQAVLTEYSEIVTDLKMRWHRRDEAKRRVEEVEEPLDVIDQKCKILAQALSHSEHLVVYTGAGISTAARIPDYRGTNGIWTRLQQGKEIGNHDLTLAEPTFTHMALSQLYHKKKLKYVVSQNCDGLHLRSGLPKSALSELHGNMYIEVCKNCKPVREYWRLFDVTENTARFSHKTMRRCYVCNGALIDTIVHFGERGTLQWPLNWSGACKNADKADTILCLGSSLKVLKRYPWLWQMNKPAKKRPNLYIVNLQWTPKDECAVMKIHGKCDEVMKRVMKLLGIDVPEYNKENDPIFKHATLLNDLEQHTTTQPTLKILNENESEIKIETDNEIKEELETESNSEIAEIVTETNEDCNELENELKMEIEENIKDIDNSINLLQAEQDEAFDLTINKRCDNTDNNYFKTAATKTSQSGSSSVTSILNDQEQFPKRKLQFQEIYPPTVFSIDSILNKPGRNDNHLIQNVNGVNSYNILSCWKFANSVLQNPMLNYFTNGFYPFQTSFMYPGFHSIINPLPYFNCDFESSTIEQPQVKAETKIEPPTCDFCYKTFESYVCLYYLKTEPVFKKQLYRFSKIKSCNKELVCECCDYTTEEESESDNESKKKVKRIDKSEIDTENDKPADNECMSENVDENNICEDQKKKNEKTDGKNAKIQAGWFGKGYRKNRKPRKKQYSNSR